MTLCEYFFVRFNARGDDEYVDRFAEHLNELLDQGWTLFDSGRETASPGWWRVDLFRDRISACGNASNAI